MACFLVPAGEAIVTTVIQKVVEHREKDAAGDGEQSTKVRGKWSQRLRWLNTMLWGGVILLALEHLWHGEIVPWPPFLTAMKNPADVGPMLHEIATYGVTMAVAVTVAWAALVLIAEARAKAEGLSGAEPTSIGGGA